jgi:D-alanine-D-alanine ligase-like ATP-grasp enzyme
MPGQQELRERLERITSLSLQNWQTASGPEADRMRADAEADMGTEHDLERAIALARKFCPDVIIEELIEGEDLRIIVIDHQIVAAAVRRPPFVVGTGNHTVQELIEKYIIEANERPGLANHEPQTTAERLIDLLFPQTADNE